VLAARRLERLEALAAELAENGPEALAVKCDVADEAQIDALVASTLGRFGRIDVLVNNAGITEIAPAESESLAAQAEPTPDRNQDFAALR
jgi:NADP-dependent 3-hydroxy acid dehydrogenase YdfG